jgi:hypothetical protein
MIRSRRDVDKRTKETYAQGLTRRKKKKKKKKVGTSARCPDPKKSGGGAHG